MQCLRYLIYANVLIEYIEKILLQLKHGTESSKCCQTCSQSIWDQSCPLQTVALATIFLEKRLLNLNWDLISASENTPRHTHFEDALKKQYFHLFQNSTIQWNNLLLCSYWLAYFLYQVGTLWKHYYHVWPKLQPTLKTPSMQRETRFVAFLSMLLISRRKELHLQVTGNCMI